LIDCDVHNNWTDAQVLLPYLPPAFRGYLEIGELPGEGAIPHAHRPFLHPEDYKRLDAVPPSGAVAGSDLDFMREQHLDAYGVDFAILTSEDIREVSTLSNPYYAQALCSAHNDWLIEEWLSRDPRLKGSLAVAPQDPAGAAREIRRVGGHPDIVQVLVSTGSERPYGDPFYHPIWEACAEMGLPLAAHLGGQGGINPNPTGCGPSTFFWETHALLCETGMGHVASVLAHGVFEKWPTAHFVLIECGVAWLPPILWRLDADYRALRKETPWVKRLPSEYAREHIRLTTQPLEQPINRGAQWAGLEDIGAQDMLMFSSDYPHWDFDDPRLVTMAIPEAWREQVTDGNARMLYGLPVPAEPSASSAASLLPH
jgi:predicted TIM-barrel fold metal-dependent hydrolase